MTRSEANTVKIGDKVKLNSIHYEGIYEVTGIDTSQSPMCFRLLGLPHYYSIGFCKLLNEEEV